MNKNKSWPMFAAVCGMVASLYACAYVAWAGGAQPNYSWINATISELGVPGTLLATPTAAMFIATGFLQVVFALGLYRYFSVSSLLAAASPAATSAKVIVSATLGTIMIAIEGVFDSVGSGVFPTEPGGTSETPMGKVHFAVSVIGLAATVAAPFFLGWAFGKGHGSKFISRASFATGLFFAVLTMLGLVMAAFELPGVGFAQRIMYYFYFAWIFGLSIKIFRCFFKQSQFRN